MFDVDREGGRPYRQVAIALAVAFWMPASSFLAVYLLGLTSLRGLWLYPVVVTVAVFPGLVIVGIANVHSDGPPGGVLRRQLGWFAASLALLLASVVGQVWVLVGIFLVMTEFSLAFAVGTFVSNRKYESVAIG